MGYKVPAHCYMRTDNPQAEITSPFKGLPRGFNRKHRLNKGGKVTPEMQATMRALSQCHYQTADDAYSDIPKHREVYLGDTLHVRVHVDKYGKVGTQTLPEYSIRRPGTIRALQTTGGFPKHQAATPCNLTEGDISNIVLGAIEQGIPFSYCVVRPKFGRHHSGDILVFWPSNAPFYGAAALDKLGTCVDLNSYTEEEPLDPRGIHVCIPWLSEEFFNGTYTICCGSGRKRLLVVNGGWYDGGCKKPLTFQQNDRRLPEHSPYIVTHWAITELLNDFTIAIGTTTAAGKTEGSSDEKHLKQAGMLFWEFPTEKRNRRVRVAIGKGSLLAAGLLPGTRRKIFSDDITAVANNFVGVPHGVELEPFHFNRIDLCTGPNTLAIAEDAARGLLDGRVYWYNVAFDAEKQEFIPWQHLTIDGQKCTNPRLSYAVEANRDFVMTTPAKPRRIDALVLSIPVPDMPHGWHMPTFMKLTVSEFFVNNCHGARANKGNPALGAIGNGYWAFEGFGGKAGFTLDTEAEMLSRDLSFWRSLSHETPCFIVFNGFSMGGRQEFKYSATFLLRCLLEHWNKELLNAPLIKIPGVFTGGVPDLSTFLPEGALDRSVWDPRTLNPEYLERDAKELDIFCVHALNQIGGQCGLGPGSTRLLGDLTLKHSIACRN